MIYAWKSGSRQKVSADIAGAVCHELEKEGRLDAQTLVDVSRAEDAPLHKEFEWDDAIAAEEFRKKQARDIISHLIVVAEDSAAQPVRAFFNVSEDTPTYDSFETVIKSETKYEQLKARAIKELIAIQKRYAMINGMGELSAVIEHLRETA